MVMEKRSWGWWRYKWYELERNFLILNLNPGTSRIYMPKLSLKFNIAISFMFQCSYSQSHSQYIKGGLSRFKSTVGLS